MAGEVSNALNQIDGILEARVIVMVPETNDLTQPENKPMPSSSVLVKFRPSEDGSPPITADAIKQFVATAVPEMKPTAVTVVMTPALPPSAEISAESRLQDVLGLRMTASSAGQFRVMVAVASLLILAMLGLSAWTFMRGGAGAATARPTPRRRPEA
jgi:type III secretion protein J